MTINIHVAQDFETQQTRELGKDAAGPSDVIDI